MDTIDNDEVDNIHTKNIDYIYATVFDRIDDIIKKYPNIENVLKNDKYVIAMIHNNIPKKFAYATSLAKIILLILVMYNNLPKKNNEECNDSEDDRDIPDID